ncbi:MULTISPECIES: hypothetical protein [Tessaracoccus]|uniref:hypothetical protein n=1 Tax=Tessaracoccus TaxID=72763 RepID=UPI00099D52E1|nr:MULTISPECIES: hypothetical protein [Tessaracoccus]AQX16665.1 hypothetical protein BKM78_12660 [Tessaracoccus sp. T2.5-30]VEP41386.1 hypothetical protein TLA_TLA_02549 [Tessaracoccus lapidicaptus]
MAFDSPAPISRRTVAKGIAWTAPAVAIASTAPAFAVSNPQVWFENQNVACKLPGASCEKETGVTKGYAVRVRVCTNVTEPITVTFNSVVVRLDGVLSPGWTIEPVELAGAIEGQVSCTYIDLGIEGEPNSENVSIEGTASFTWVADDNFPSGSGSLTFSAPSTPPCVNCSTTGA